MGIKSLAQVATRKAAGQIFKAKKHSPAFMFAAGVIGVTATVVLASRATLKLEAILDKANEDFEIADQLLMADREDYTAEDAHQDRIKIRIKTGLEIAKLYGPAFLVGAASVGLLTGSHVVLTRRNTSLIAAYAMLDRGFKEYRQRVQAAVGTEKELDIRFNAQDKDIVVEDDKGTKIVTFKTPGIPGGRSIYARLFDETTSKEWQSGHGYNQFFVQCQQNYANDKLRHQGHLFLNEVLDMLGLERSPEGQLVGWLYNTCEGEGDGFVDFGVFAGNREDGMRWVTGSDSSVWLDFNVDGMIYDKI